jgi:hypothetical protein
MLHFRHIFSFADCVYYTSFFSQKQAFFKKICVFFKTFVTDFKKKRFQYAPNQKPPVGWTGGFSFNKHFLSFVAPFSKGVRGFLRLQGRSP